MGMTIRTIGMARALRAATLADMACNAIPMAVTRQQPCVPPIGTCVRAGVISAGDGLKPLAETLSRAEPG